jgi:hypothetical protein
MQSAARMRYSCAFSRCISLIAARDSHATGGPKSCIRSAQIRRRQPPSILIIRQLHESRMTAPCRAVHDALSADCAPADPTSRLP